ncbi:2Fe-2S iron-sulfur cluster-binding protein [Bradyrhizobium liaoningense]|uniref:2Fe-2S iron-sulfur cluster-binding protein n=1 Tax=Bradyrhizobium liaoningense TaxID=43992 RepID=UPI00390899D9
MDQSPAILAARACEWLLAVQSSREARGDVRCKRGECGLCAIDVVAVDGEIDHRDVFFSDHQKHENTKICACVSRARGTITVDTLHRADAV